MATHRDGHPDAGMLAVARVRGVREQDSRLGLRRASDDQAVAARRLAAVEEQSATTDHAPGGSTALFLAAREHGRALALEVRRADQALSVAGTVTDAARDHWQHDRTRLAAVELLLERREAERRAERERRETREIDDLVTARWLREHREVDPS